MNFSELLREAIKTAQPELPDPAVDSLCETLLELLHAWVAIHEPDADPENVQDPQRALVLQMLEELSDRVPIPIVS